MPEKQISAYHYSKASERKIKTCDTRLQLIFYKILEFYDHTILCGHRGEEEQTIAFQEGFSQTPWPESEHNPLPSNAVDAVPYLGKPWDFQDPNLEALHFFAGIVRSVAYQYKIGIRWGGDWNSNFVYEDETFRDLYHYELVPTVTLQDTSH